MSRGLGDVYKRQSPASTLALDFVNVSFIVAPVSNSFLLLSSILFYDSNLVCVCILLFMGTKIFQVLANMDKVKPLSWLELRRGAHSTFPLGNARKKWGLRIAEGGQLFPKKFLYIF